MRLPSTKQLQYFVALAEAGHFGRAADASFVSQSAFSNAIKELETLLDVQLVDRTNRQVTITAIGQQVAVQARLCLRDVQSLVEMTRGQQRPMSGELHLGVIPTIAPFVLPNVLPALRKSYPEMQLFLYENQTQRIYERLMDGELDLILLALPYDMRGVDVMPLWRDHFALAYREGTSRVDPGHYRFNRLEADSVLLLEDGHCLRDHALTACRIRNTQKVRRIAASSILTLIEMVDADLGVTFLPEMAADSALLRNTHVRLKPLGKSSYRTIGLGWRKGSARVDDFHTIGRFLADQR
jgi:LysR family transcriptional regulator, hydrogen peroxide-inducible genes activator